MKRTTTTLLLLTALFFVYGCGNRAWEDTKEGAGDTYDFLFDDAPTARAYHDTAEIPIIELNYKAADVLYANVDDGELTMKSAVFVRRFVNQKDPGDNAIFGYVMTQQVADRLVQHDILITDGKPNKTDYQYAEGKSATDYANRSALRDDLPPRSAMLIGSYVIADQYIYMSAKVIRLVDSAVVSAHNWTLPITDNIREMLPQLKKDEGLSPTVKTSFE
ncbi:FlgO family outer membrane protein [Pseudodesulfovibrio sediminis]|uniref:FlgO domain-containing protein n=1 Tax=Pseudodesulfovibrio sediminis TaxID=2810563 RepID=A0ABM7P267_9BACT|nr:FlgO family outer membrane protein [Pseudodesulfovibrio sediminis]BCS86886.1 hypothetical protein PSDVSF_01280 [Pseudodesulfovibrio sediminis]